MDTQDLVINPTQTWLSKLADVIAFGCPVVTRNEATTELINQSLHFSLENPVIDHPARKLSYAFMAAEAYWILKGSNKLDFLTPFAPSYEKYSDDGLTLAGAYGPRIMSQMHWVKWRLKDDPHSRQAVMTIWTPKPAPSRDIPCTVSLQWLIRKGVLSCIVNMRSSDLWLGLPYDLFSFTMVTLWLWMELDKEYELGMIYFNLGSCHLYTKNQEAAHAIAYDHVEGRIKKTIKAPMIGSPDHLLDILDHKRHGPRDQVITIP